MTPVSRISPVHDPETLRAIAEEVVKIMPQNSGRFGLLKWLVGLGITIAIAWGGVNIKVAVLDNRMSTVEGGLTEMRQDIKTLLQRVR